MNADETPKRFPIRVLFIGNVSSPSASGRQRLWAIQQLVSDVLVLDKSKFPLRFGRWSSSLAKCLGSPNLIWSTSDVRTHISKVDETFEPQLIWIEWPREFSVKAIRELKATHPNALLISFQDDNPWGARKSDRWMWKNYFRCIPEFDLHLVKRSVDVDNIGRCGGRECMTWVHGVYTPVFHPIESSTPPRFPISFIGTCMDDRNDLIEELLVAGYPLHVFGSRWHQRTNLPKRFPHNFHEPVEGVAYANVIRASQICLGLVSKSNHDEWTMRTFEVPACATALLAERTESHNRWFVEGVEIELFSDAKECQLKLEIMLQDPEYCYNLGRAAYSKCMNEKWTIEDRMRQLFSSEIVTRINQ